jgi:hypothetical protein
MAVENATDFPSGDNLAAPISGFLNLTGHAEIEGMPVPRFTCNGGHGSMLLHGGSAIRSIG